MLDPVVTTNPYILLVATKQGGHVAFISARTRPSNRPIPDTQHSALSTQYSALDSDDSSLITHHSSLPEDRFWAENRVVEFCAMAQAAL
jgi:predicted alpha/beta-fold hydrolase